jgi:thiamine-phosphate diphosphorylase
VSEPPAPEPALLILTDRRLCEAAGHSLPEVIAAAAGAGARQFLFREKDLDGESRRVMALACLRIAAAHGASVAIASDTALAADLGGLVVHLAAADARPQRPTRWGRSCHGAGEVRAAAAEGAAYVTASPVFASASKPGYGPVLGETGLRALVDAAPGLPVYALGGISPQTCATCVRAGAAGVAVMTCVMAAADPANAVARLLGRLEAAVA